MPGAGNRMMQADAEVDLAVQTKSSRASAIHSIHAGGSAPGIVTSGRDPPGALADGAEIFRGKNRETFVLSSLAETSLSIVRRNVAILNHLRQRDLAMTGDAMPKKNETDGVAIRDDVPWSEDLTDYDRHHFVTYVRLLDAVEDGASEEEICRIVLGIDSAKEPKRAKRAFESHLRRARWMTENGYRHLLQ